MQATTSRVETNTASQVNEGIWQDMEQRIAAYSKADPDSIEQRLAELDSEWTIERVIETEAPVMVSLGVLLGLLKDRRWLGLSAMSASMVLLHNVQGWYPLMPLLRRLGLRSQNEIEHERFALRLLLGEHARPFNGTPAASSPATLH